MQGVDISIRNRLLGIFCLALDVAMIPLVGVAAPILWFVRRFGLQRMPACRWVLVRIGVLPLRRHYYDPYVDAGMLDHSLDRPRELPGIDMREAQQLLLLSRMVLGDEARQLGEPSGQGRDYYFGNGSFESGDAEFLYQFIRLTKPRRVVEIGSGFSTLVVQRALRANRQDDPATVVSHTCIEPFEMPWLESLGVRIIRSRVESVPMALFDELESGDLLFVDSSHVIRPQGDVLHEYLQVLPRLKAGVYVHIHDIFLPRDYPREWVLERMWLWNEQYLVEAMLSHGSSWQVVAALNFLKHAHYDALKAVCPCLSREREPGSLYLVKSGSPG